MKSIDLSNRVTIVTGGANGIGRAIALAMAAAGATVIIADLDTVKSEQVVDQIRDDGGNARAIQTDISEFAQCRQLVKQVVDSEGKIDILVNNAGFGRHTGGLFGILPADLEQTLKTNVSGPLFLTKLVAEIMRAQGIGTILWISSIHGKSASYTDDPIYAASKAAIESFVRTLALELAPYGIRVNGVAPGAIAVGTFPIEYPVVPLHGRRGLPEDIAHSMVFLASDLAGYITGQILAIAGGLDLVAGV